MRLINADDLKKEFDIIASKSATGDWQSIPIKHIKQIIDNAPTVEEVSVIELKEPLPLVKTQKIVKALSKRPQKERMMENNSIPNSKITNDALIRYKPVSTVTVGSIQTVIGECVITKEEFLLAYNTWVLGENYRPNCDGDMRGEKK